MSVASIPEAQAQLTDLIARALSGEDVIIAEAGRPLVRLTPIVAADSPRVGGQWRGRVRIAADFDSLPPDVAAALEVEPVGLLGDRWRP